MNRRHPVSAFHRIAGRNPVTYRIAGRDSDTRRVLGRDPDAPEAKTVQISPENPRAVQKPPENPSSARAMKRRHPVSAFQLACSVQIWPENVAR